MSGVGFLWVSRFPIVFLVRRELLRSVCLKMLVMYEVSLPIYVKLAHFLEVLGSFGFAGLRMWGLWSLMGKELFCKMLWMVFSSCWYSSCCRL